LRSNLNKMHHSSSLLIICFVLLFTSCKKDSVQPPAQGTSGFVVFNLAPDQNNLLVAIDGRSMSGTALKYATYSGNYISIFKGSRDVNSYDQLTNLILADTTVDFRDSSFYSLFFIGLNGHYKNFVAEDKLSSIPKNTGNAFVRYLYGIADSSHAHVTIEKDGNKIFDENNSFGNISDFKPIAPGDVSVSVKSDDNTINTQRTLTLQSNGVYTVLLQGFAQTLDTTQQIKIGYIQNSLAQ